MSLAIAMLAAALQAAPAADGQRLAVVDVVPLGVPPELTRTLTGAIAEEAGKTPGVAAMSQEQIAGALVTEKQKQLLGSTDEASLAELGKTLGANQVLSGTLGKVGVSFVLQLQLFDTANAKVLDRLSRTVTDEGDLMSAARDLVHQLLTGQALDTTGKLRLAIDPPGAAISIDGKPMGESPLEAPLAVGEGPHKLSVRKEGYVGYDATVEVVRGQVLFNSVELVSLSGVGTGSGNWQKTTGWISLGVSAVAFGAATYFGLQAVSEYDNYQSAVYNEGEPSIELYGANYYKQQTVSNQTPANVSFVAGGATAALALAFELWGYLKPSTPRSP